MVRTSAATQKQRRSSRARNENRPWGWQPTILAKWRHDRLKKDVERGVLPKSCLNVTMRIIGGKKRG